MSSGRASSRQSEYSWKVSTPPPPACSGTAAPGAGVGLGLRSGALRRAAERAQGARAAQLRGEVRDRAGLRRRLHLLVAVHLRPARSRSAGCRRRCRSPAARSFSGTFTRGCPTPAGSCRRPCPRRCRRWGPRPPRRAGRGPSSDSGFGRARGRAADGAARSCSTSLLRSLNRRAHVELAAHVLGLHAGHLSSPSLFASTTQVRGLRPSSLSEPRSEPAGPSPAAALARATSFGSCS